MKRIGYMILVLSLLAVGYNAKRIWATTGSQFNWATSTGGAWQTPDDTTTTVGQILQVGASGGANVQAGGAPASAYPRTKAQLIVLTPGTTGQFAYCSDCTNTPIVVSSGIAQGAWEGVFQSTTGSLNGITALK